MDLAYFYLTDEGHRLAKRLSAVRPGDIYGKDNFKYNLREAFHKYDYLVCIMSTGIVVRILAPLIVHKTSDPGVVVMDQKGRHAISLLSGHLGGANDLAREMASISGGEPVITTATDVAGELSFDSFAKAHHMAIENIGVLKSISGTLLSGKPVAVITDYDFPEIAGAVSDGKIKLLSKTEYPEPAGSYAGEPMPAVVIDEGLVLTGETLSVFRPVLYLRPRTICAGIGCKRNMEASHIEKALRNVLEEEHLSPLSLKCISTIPLKADEPGILATARQLSVPVTVISTEEIESLDMDSLNIRQSDFVAQQTGVLSVSTASAYLASGKGTILRDKVKFKGITVALCRQDHV